MSVVYDFDTQLQWSNGHAPHGVETILRNRIPDCVAVVRADADHDRNGTDHWAVRPDPLPPLSIDLKARAEDWAPRGDDDLALETWSVIGQKLGWTRDTSKRTDYILWYWADTKRFCILPFHPLCRMFRLHMDEWCATYKVCRQDSGLWRSECVFVPRMVVQEAVWRWQNGCLKKAV